MRIIRCLMGLFVFVSAVIPSWLWADQPAVEPSGNTLTVKSSANTLNPQAAVALPEVVVTANRLNTPVSQVASSLTVITAKDLEIKQSTTILDALRDVPGMDVVESGASGQISTAFIRGANAEHTLVLMDGIPLNDPSSTTREFDDMDQTFPADVKQIEVVRGPESPLYGSSAMGGVVNIVTRGGQGPAQGSLLFEGGAYGTFKEALQAGVGGPAAHFSLSLSRFDTQGFPSADRVFGNVVNDGNQNSTASLNLGSQASPDLSNNLLVRFTQSRTGLSHGGGPGADDPNYFVDGTQMLAGTRSNLKLFNGFWEQSLGLSFLDHLRRFTDDLNPAFSFSYYDRGTYDGQSGQVDWQNNFHFTPGEILVAGVQAQQEWINVDDKSSFDGVTFFPTGIKNGASSTGFFIENQAAIGDRLFLTAGGRLDAQNLFASKATYRFAAAYFVPGLEAKLKATYGTGFRAPSLYQLYSPFGNTSLLPEENTGWDAGFEQPLFAGALKCGATYFRNDFIDLIDYDFNTNQYFNIYKATTEGVEVFFSAHPVKALECRLNYTYTDARDIDRGVQLLRRPWNKGSFSAFYQWGKGDAGFDVSYVGDRIDYPYIPLQPYTLVNLMASYQVDEHLNFFGRVNNLFNLAYEEVYGFGTPGLSFYAGTKVSL